MLWCFVAAVIVPGALRAQAETHVMGWVCPSLCPAYGCVFSNLSLPRFKSQNQMLVFESALQVSCQACCGAVDERLAAKLGAKETSPTQVVPGEL